MTLDMTPGHIPRISFEIAAAATGKGSCRLAKHPLNFLCIQKTPKLVVLLDLPKMLQLQSQALQRSCRSHFFCAHQTMQTPKCCLLELVWTNPHLARGGYPRKGLSKVASLREGHCQERNYSSTDSAKLPAILDGGSQQNAQRSSKLSATYQDTSGIVKLPGSI